VTRRTTLSIGAAAFAAFVTLTACSSSGNQAGGTTSSAAATPTSASASAMDAHNQADVSFAQRMIPHHQQAIEMSDIVLAKQGIDPRVVDLANKIKAAQGPEIQTMHGWLGQWGQPTMPMSPPTEMPSGSMMPSSSMMPGQGDMDMPGHDGMPGMGGMSGMMSPEDMTELQNAQGIAAGKLFLTQMIQHHQGAITMAQNEIGSGQYPAAIDMARSIVTSQQQEITTMQGLLSSM
jgi:uncharacterized protein (DUF305 family)